MCKKISVFIVVFFYSGLCFSQSLFLHANNLKVQSSTTQDKTSQNQDVQSFGELPLETSLEWLNKNYVESSDDFHEKALLTLDRAYELEDELLKAKTHHVLMRWHAFHVPFTSDSILPHGEKAIALFKKVNDQEKAAMTSVELSFEYIEGNNTERSEQLIFDAIKIYEDSGNEKGLGTAFSKLSSIFLSQKEPELSIKYGLKALELTEKVKDHFTTQETWLALILAYHAAGELEKAIYAADKCIETIKIYNIDDEFNLARAYAYRGDVWADLEEYQKSLEDNVKSYEIVKAKVGSERPAVKT